MYYIRFSAHDNEIKGHAYTSFNLLNYSNWGQLQKYLRNLFLLSNKENSYKIIHYYKAAKYETEKRWRKDLKYMDTNSLINILKK